MEKRRCGGCIYLNKLKKDGLLCSSSGKNKGCTACKNWEPDIEALSPNIQNVISLLGACEASDIAVLEWVLKKQEALLANPRSNPLFRIGQVVWYCTSTDEGGQIYQIRIQNVTAKHAIGTDLEYGTSFFLPLDTRVFSSRKELLADQQRVADLRQQLSDKPQPDDSGVGLVLGKVKDGIFQPDEQACS